MDWAKPITRQDKKHLSVGLWCESYIRGLMVCGCVQWVNLCLDLSAMVCDTWRGQGYKSVESLCISASCRLRRIFTMKAQPPDTTNDEGKPHSNVQCSISYSIEEEPFPPRTNEICKAMAMYDVMTYVFDNTRCKCISETYSFYSRIQVNYEGINPADVLEQIINTYYCGMSFCHDPS